MIRSDHRWWVYLPMLFYLACAQTYHLADEQAQTYRINEKTVDSAEDTEIEQMIKPYRDQLTAEMDEMIGLVATALEKTDGESTLGNFVADAVLSEAEHIAGEEFDFGICNSGGLRIPGLPAGPLTRGRIFELMPFDNYLVTMEVPGTMVIQLFDRMAAAGGWPISHGVSYEIKDNKAQNIMIKGQALNPESRYTFVLSDYLAEGGGDLAFLKDYPYRNLNVYYRDAIIQYVSQQQAQSRSIDARLEGRIINLDN